MRVVAGDAKGRPLVAPKGRDTRPTTDRVRGAIFNALHSLGGVADMTVLDLFAGSGALGIEALSRGASHVTFIDRDRQALDAVRANVATLGFADRATIRQGDAASISLGPAELALLDPPYSFDDGQWTALLTRLDAALVVIESDRVVVVPEGWLVLRKKAYGTTVVTIARNAGAHTDDAAEEGPHSP